MLDHWFWLLLSVACVLWYITVTGYVAVKGFADIRSMLRRLAQQKQDDSTADTNRA